MKDDIALIGEIGGNRLSLYLGNNQQRSLYYDSTVIISTLGSQKFLLKTLLSSMSYVFTLYTCVSVLVRARVLVLCQAIDLR